MAARQRVDRERNSPGEILDAPPKRFPVWRFHDRVNVILLNTEVDDLEGLARRPLDTSSNRVEEPLLTQPRGVRLRPLHDIHVIG